MAGGVLIHPARFLCGVFVGLIGEEQRFRHYYRRYVGMTVASIRDIDPEPAGYLPHIKDEDEPAIEQKIENRKSQKHC